MISYGISARPALARLMQHYNDIDVYVEDSTYLGVYKKLINKALGGRASVASVTALGPKSVVLDRAYNDNSVGGRPRLYIVDGDFDFVAMKRQRSARHLYRLNVYSLENLVFERVSAYAVSELSIPGQEDVVAHAAVEYDEIIRDLNDDLAKLFLVYAIAHRLKVTESDFRIESVSVSDSHTSRVFRVNKAQCRAKTLKLVRLLIHLKGRNRYRLARRAVVENVTTKNFTGEYFVPGKEFHLKYLVGRIGRHGGTCLGQRTVVACMAENCTFSRDPRLVRRLRKVAKKP
jgi:hypothetical protein